MSELKKEELIKKIKHWKNECENNAEHHGYNCGDCREGYIPVSCNQAYQQIVALIQKPQVTEEWIDLADEKLWFAIRENPEAFACKDDDYEHEKIRKDLLRSLVEEIQGKK